MNSKRWVALLALIAMLTVVSTMAQAADGTLQVTFKYKDPTTGVEQNLNYGYIYLHSAANGAPMEKFFTRADVIVGPSNYGNGVYTRQVPAGTYYIRITQRKVLQTATRPYGPPEEGDYTWMQPTPIIVTAGNTLNLGTKYAYPFAASPITITGTVKSGAGAPLAGRYVRASSEPCTDWWNYGYVNQCGSVKNHALRPTDANGNYTLILREPGTYYLYTHTSWDPNSGCSGYCEAPIMGSWGATVTVKRGDKLTANIIGY